MKMIDKGGGIRYYAVYNGGFVSMTVPVYRSLCLGRFSFICLTFFLAVQIAGTDTVLAGIRKSRALYNTYTVSETPSAGLLNINNIAMWALDNGQMERVPFDANAGTTFPRGTAPAVYAGGTIWGGLVEDGVTPRLRVGGQTYNSGTVPGSIVDKGIRESPNNSSVRLFRIRRDYATADLRQDASEFFFKPLSDITQSDVDALRAQYKRDWLAWPWQKGAPYYDRNNNGMYDPDPNGVYDPAKDEPGIAFADQVLWFVCNDLDSTATKGLYGSPPVGFELQVTCWAYNTLPFLQNVIFQRYRIIYKGTTSSSPSSHIDSMYIAKWVDPDLGDYGDDFAGCDTSLMLGYCYNSGPVDAEYQKFNLPPPAIGYDILQGPVVHAASNDTASYNFTRRAGLKNLPMTTFVLHATGDPDADPELGNYIGTLQWYNMLRGFRPRPISPLQPFIDPTTNQPTKFEMAGDPIRQAGWIDGIRDPGGDRHIILVSGPFSLALHDSQEVVLALIGGLANDYLSSITALQSIDRRTQSFYDGLVSSMLGSLPPSVSTNSIQDTIHQQTRITVLVNASASQVVEITGLLTRPDHSLFQTFDLYDDGFHGDSLADDHIYGGSVTVSPVSSALFVSLQVTNRSGFSLRWNDLSPPITTTQLQIPSFTLFSDNLNENKIADPGENIRYGVTVENRSSFTMTNLVVTPIINPTYRRLVIGGLPRGSFSMEYRDSDPSSFFTIDIPREYTEPTYNIPLEIVDDQLNRWWDTVRIPVEQLPVPPITLSIDHPSGDGGEFEIIIADPSAVTGHAYEITITDSSDSTRTKRFNVRDLTTGTMLAIHHPMPDSLGHDSQILDGFKILPGSSQIIKPEVRSWEMQTPSNRDRRMEGVPYSNGGISNDGLAYVGGDWENRDHRSSVQKEQMKRVELRFGKNDSSWAYRYLTNAYHSPVDERYRLYIIRYGYGYPYQDTTRVPFSAWDMFSHPPRQLAVGIIENNEAYPLGWIDGKWGPTGGTNGGREQVIVFAGDYDPDANTSYYKNNLGSPRFPDPIWLDAMYILAVRLRTDIVPDAGIPPPNPVYNDGDVLTIHPFLSVTSLDTFRFSTRSVSYHHSLPIGFQLKQNYPNPFNGETNFKIWVPENGSISMKIYDEIGREVVFGIEEELFPGIYVRTWNGSNFASGVYFYRLTLKSGSHVETQTRKMLLIK